jgi:hypothetical protein
MSAKPPRVIKTDRKIRLILTGVGAIGYGRHWDCGCYEVGLVMVTGLAGQDWHWIGGGGRAQAQARRRAVASGVELTTRCSSCFWEDSLITSQIDGEILLSPLLSCCRQEENTVVAVRRTSLAPTFFLALSPNPAVSARCPLVSECTVCM